MRNDKCHNAMPICVKCAQAIPAALLILLILWTYYTFLVEFCIIELKKSISRRIINLIIGNFLFLLFGWCYVHVMMCRENFLIPEQFKLSEAEHNRLLGLHASKQSEILEHYIQNRHLTLWLRTSENLIRYCMKCHQIKPDRAHHCSTCASCVLKMDHHCPWVNNCVGFANQKSFMLMLMYGTLACLFYSLALVEYYLHVGVVKPDIHTGILCSGFASSLTFALADICMFEQQFNDLILKNETISENFQIRRRTVKFTDDNLTFNLGLRANFLECFGRKKWKWFLPINTSYTNGLIYKVRHNRNKLPFFLSVFMGLFLFILYCQHVFLLFTNVTVLETIQEPHFSNARLTFNLGKAHNILDTCGESCIKWWIPNNSSFGNGVYFEVRYKSGSSRRISANS